MPTITETGELQAYAPNGEQIMGTYEMLPCRANIAYFFRQDDGSLMYEHAGDTTEFWDGQETVTRNGKVVFLCTAGEEWTADQLRFKDEHGRWVKRAPLWADKP